MNKHRKVLISGGGTGGHIYPALAIAQEFKARYANAEFLFVGANGRMEMEKVPAAGFPIKGLWISGIDRSFSLRNLAFPFKLITAIIKSYFIIRSFKPNVVIGTGGFASGPILWVASRMKIPTLIQEQNSFPGITNKLLSSKVDRICVAYHGLDRFFPEHKIRLTGNPIRKGIGQRKADKSEAVSYFGLTSNKQVILVLGGSLGAKVINDFIRENLRWFQENEVQLIWQTGKLYYEQCAKTANTLGYEGVHVSDFISRMDLAYQIADVAISRAGASTVSEMCVAGLPVILVPSPNVAEDHQTKNALSLVDREAAILVKEAELPLRLFPALRDVVTNVDKREAMKINISALAEANAAELIVNHIEEIIR
jgi:UDP-N-acetylglucosamine--N-acetylmuramyl-(pentapeptide) pyrophosphoryl-undecaprenol N-acetylglucosamine transferase